MSLCDGHTTIWNAQKRHLCLGRGTEEKQSRAMGRESAAWHHIQLGQPWGELTDWGAKWPWQNSQSSSSLACPAIVYHHFRGKQGFIALVSATIHHRYWQTVLWWCFLCARSDTLSDKMSTGGCCPCTPSLTTPCSLLFKWKKYHLFWEDLWVTCHKSRVYEPCSSLFNVKIQHFDSRCFQHYGCGREYIEYNTRNTIKLGWASWWVWSRRKTMFSELQLTCLEPSSFTKPSTWRGEFSWCLWKPEYFPLLCKNSSLSFHANLTGTNSSVPKDDCA